MSYAYELSVRLSKKLTTEIGALSNKIRLRGYQTEWDLYDSGSMSATISTIGYLQSFLGSERERDEVEVLLLKLYNEWRYLLTVYCHKTI